MKKLRMFLVLAGIVACSLFSLSFERNRDTVDWISVGEKAPELIVDGDTIHFSQLTLVCFWSSVDGSSRERNVALSNKYSGNDSIKFVSVSFDRYPSVFRACISQDGLDSTECHLDTLGSDSRMYKAYSLNHGYKNCLIDSTGTIIAVNYTN